MVKYLEEVVESARSCDADLCSSLDVSELVELGSSAIDTGVPHPTALPKTGRDLLYLDGQFPGREK